MNTLYYVLDPMCSWCYGFSCILKKLFEKLPSDIEVKFVQGGLAQHSELDMKIDMQKMLIATWKQIQTQTEVAAQSIELDMDRFRKDLHSKKTIETFQKDMQLAASSNVQGFPSLILSINQKRYPISINYKQSDKILQQINYFIEQSK